MNKARMLAVANRIEKNPEHLDMRKVIWVRDDTGKDAGTWPIGKPRPSLGDCGTVACIAGHAILMFGTDEDLQDATVEDNFVDVAARLLDLDVGAAHDLFYWSPNFKSLWWVTAAEAAGEIRRLVAQEG